MPTNLKAKDHIKITKFVQQRKIKMVIDLAGPLGNAFFLLATAQQLAMHFGRDPDICTKMTSGDYSNLLSAFRSEFGEYVHLVDTSGHYGLRWSGFVRQPKW